MKKTAVTFTRFLISILLLTVTALAPATSLLAEDGPDTNHLRETIRASNLFELVETLSSSQYEGRFPGTAGYDKAAGLAAETFKKAGLVPAFPGYQQTFPLSYTLVAKSTLAIQFKNEEGKDETVSGEYFTNFYPLLFSGSGDVEGAVVFAGYGVTAPEFEYDDYKGLDVNGKIVMIIKGAPTPRDGENWLPYDNHRFRTQNAHKHGAVGLLYIHGKAIANPNGKYIKDFPMVQLHVDMADKLLKKYGKSVNGLKKQLNNREWVSFATDMTAHMTVESKNLKGVTSNVVGYIPGSDPVLKDEFLVIGAHLDHCGKWPVWTPGADDNATGSSAVITLAGALGSYPHKLKRSVMFVLFTGEEMGLLGSRHFVENLPAPVKKVRFLFNLDMVGAGPNMFILRMKNYPEFETLVKKAHRVFDVPGKLSGNKVVKPRRAAADHAPFVEKGIPAVSIFSGGGDHHGYHSDQDTIYWITPKIMEDITRVLGYSVIVMANE